MSYVHPQNVYVDSLVGFACHCIMCTHQTLSISQLRRGHCSYATGDHAETIGIYETLAEAYEKSGRTKEAFKLQPKIKRANDASMRSKILRLKIRQAEDICEALVCRVFATF